MRALVIIIASFISLGALAQFSVEAELDTSHIRIGEQAQLVFNIHGVEAPDFIEWPLFADALPDAVEIVDTTDVFEVTQRGNTYLEFALKLTAWDSGYYAIEPMEFAFLSEYSSTEATLLTVSEVQADLKLPPAAIKDIYDEPFSLIEWLGENWLMLLVILLVGLLIWLLVIYYTKKKQQESQSVLPEPSLSPYEQAIVELQTLERTEAYKSSDLKLYYSALTGSLRQYIEGRYGIAAMELTSYEILRASESLDITAEQRDYLSSLLNTADRIKFAKGSTEELIARQHLSEGLRFLETSRVAPTPEADE